MSDLMTGAAAGLVSLTTSQALGMGGGGPRPPVGGGAPIDWINPPIPPIVLPLPQPLLPLPLW